jgi:bifunctional DNase/RNase
MGSKHGDASGTMASGFCPKRNFPTLRPWGVRSRPLECRMFRIPSCFHPRHQGPYIRHCINMNKPVIPVEIRTVLPFNSGRAVFIGNEEKVFVIYVDESVGAAIAMFLNDTPKERPLTHDLIGHLMTALGAKVDRVIINDLKSETYFARLIISAENELFEKKIVELDGRPSDCIALAIQQKAPIYVSRDVWDEVEDRSDVLRHLEENGRQGESET